MDKSSIDILWVLISASLVFLMQGGFLCLESGLTRSKNNINVALKNLTDFGISITLYWAVGFTLMFGISKGGWGSFNGFFPDFAQLSPWESVFFLFQAMFCGTAVTILSGAVAERMRFKGYVIISILISGLIYPVFGHWSWNSLNNAETAGWLESMGFLDFAGSTVVHSVGGWVSLAALLVIGPRIGRFPKNAPPAKIPGANLPIAALGVALLWLGWIGFNGGSTLAMDDQVPRVVANTMLAGGMGMIGALLAGWTITKIVHVDYVMNGALAGLVAITANAYAVSAISSVIIGFIGGTVMVGSGFLLEKFRIDDVIGAIPVHLAAGIWGTLAVAIFGDPEILGTGLDFWQQIKVQALGIVVCFAWAFGVTYLLLKAINRFTPLRVTAEDEQIGLNVSEHGAETALLDLFSAMDKQMRSGDLSVRAPIEPFTEVGQIAERYNYVMENLERSNRALQRSHDELEEKVEERTKDLEKAHKRINLIVENANDAIITINNDQNIVMFNPAAEKTFGYKSSEVLNMPLTMLLPEPYRANHGPHVNAFEHEAVTSRAMDSRSSVNGQRQNGEIFPVEASISKMEIDGKMFYTAFVRDITERKQNEEQILKLFRAVEQSPVSVLITDPQHIIEYVNPMFTEISGYSAEEVIGKTPGIMDSKQMTPEIFHAIGNAVTEGHHWSGELLNKKKDGELYWVSASISSIKNNQGEITHFIGINEDITEQKLLQQQRDEAYDVISSSIQYASRIQRSILPSPGLMERFLPNHFVCWEPREVVGGDIYWCRPWGEGVVTILGDCTGHGVPGAFMTLISYGALIQALTIVEPGNAAALISTMHRIIQQSLGQDKENGDSNDGLELGVCYLSKERKTMTFAGARFSLFYQDRNSDVVEIKGDRKGVGYRSIPRDFVFSNQVVEISPERRFILTTDGMIDQIGGDKRQGFGKKRFINLLKELQDVSVQELGDHLYTTLKEYQGNENRRDDVSMIGFSI